MQLCSECYKQTKNQKDPHLSQNPKSTKSLVFSNRSVYGWEGGRVRGGDDRGGIKRVFNHQFTCSKWNIWNRGTATAEVDKHGAAPTYRLTLWVRCQAAPGHAFEHCALCVQGFYRLLKMSARRSLQNQSHTELCHHLWQGEQDTHTVGTHIA